MDITYVTFGKTADIIPKEAGNPSEETCFARAGKHLKNGGLIAVGESPDFVDEESNWSPAMEIAADSSSNTTGYPRSRSSTVPQILVEDWSFSEGEMEDDDDSPAPFCFVGTREKNTPVSYKPRNRSSSV